MEDAPSGSYQSEVDAIIEELVPIIRALPIGRYAISIGGSHGKRRFDELSDIDFRLFCDETVPYSEGPGEWQALRDAIARWAARGRMIDGCWVRNIAEMNEKLDAWLGGNAEPEPILWTLWGYYLPTDLANQYVIEDPYGIIAGWHARLAVYPPALKQAVLRKHLEILRYWRDDYHYENKAKRGDPVFLASMAAHLVHSLIQVLFALNETYYSGDGHNLSYLAGFRIVPPGFAEAVGRVLYPPPSSTRYTDQRQELLCLIAAVEELATPEVVEQGNHG
ncbi:MAG TPA: nucleotidyltransferase domain-containing protein [Armatimonadota bacterium]|jgi:hypothetical protein